MQRTLWFEEWPRFCFSLLWGVVVIFVVCQAGGAADSPARQFSFVALGDQPYCPSGGGTETCGETLTRYQTLIQKINDSGSEFAIHVGDIKREDEDLEHCDQDLINSRLALFGNFDHIVYVPGDNDWRDCPTAVRADRLQTLRDAFDAVPALARTRAGLKIESQNSGNSELKEFIENQMFFSDGIVFVTFNSVGESGGKSDTGLPELTLEHMLRAAHDWLDQAFQHAIERKSLAIVIALQTKLFSDPYNSCGVLTSLQPSAVASEPGYQGIVDDIERLASNYKRPVLIIHGDGHDYGCIRPFPNAPNVQVLMVPGDSHSQAVSVSVNANSTSLDQGFSLRLLESN